MIRKHKQYSRPRKIFVKQRIEEENGIKEKYGLKNKKEIWKADAAVTKIRGRAKNLIRAREEEKEAFFAKLRRQGLQVNNISDVLALDKENYLRRRLQTVLVERGLATTSKTARQLITHGHVLVQGKVINSPSYIVPIELENTITLKEKILVQRRAQLAKKEKEE